MRYESLLEDASGLSTKIVFKKCIILENMKNLFILELLCYTEGVAL